MTASDTPLTSDNDTETCENRNGRRGAGNTTDGLTHHSPLTRRRAVVSVSPDTQDRCCVHHANDHDETGCDIGGCLCNPVTTFGPLFAATDDDRAKAIVAMSKAIKSDRLTVGHAVTLVAELLAEQRAAVHAEYEQLAKWADQQADSREHFAKVDPSYRMTLIPYRAMAERIRMVAGQ